MAHLGSGRRRALVLPAGLALTASLGFLPAGTASAAPAPATDGPNLSYVVNTTGGHGTSARVQKAIAKAGGTVVVSYDRIGVVVVHSTNPAFAQEIRRAKGVTSAGATRTTPLKAQATTEEGTTQALTPAEAAKAKAAAAPGQEPLEANQWDLRAIGADKAAKIYPGSRRVTVGVIDTGVDDTHPDLAPNFSASQSANCVGGVADTSPGAWRPYTGGSDHGTHVAGEIAAARNGVGVAGVAPGVKVAGIKVAEQGSGLFFTEAVVCGFVFAAEHHIDVTNNSYYVDPWYFNCKSDPDQKALLDAVTRASRYAEHKGVLNVAAAGNENYDLSKHALTDTSSPDDQPAPHPTVTVDPAKCPDIPAQLPGVVTVAATGVQNVKSYYSSYGLGQIDVAAPGGDKYQIPDTPDKNGRILSTILGGQYGYKQGTSMATPHVVGVAALLKSKNPWASPQELREMLKEQADNPGCPTGLYDPDGNGVQDSTCEGGKRVNGFYGRGVVNALSAVTE
ncbi:S8 family serine peptidase [Streptomyces sp. TLI_146]|uniref:S8 family peptidase n=1 Tax=Streptomyces sp. TLI_146 TaxID=1938858 RepID=UPI000C70B61C|nr:S8 family serine peptidase [Streptomyces sp. TLI_146]PKV84995.1 subtilase family protein [Streptomyces sp. TLI_146]